MRSLWIGLALLLGGCSPADRAIIAKEPMIWRPVMDRSLIELRFARDPRHFVRVCAGSILDELERRGDDHAEVAFRVWGAWPWSRRTYGFNPETINGMKILHCDDPGQTSGFNGEQVSTHPLDRHL